MFAGAGGSLRICGAGRCFALAFCPRFGGAKPSRVATSLRVWSVGELERAVSSFVAMWRW
eukprot:1054864-Alexandrium_andersonii.AAC.1